MAEILKQSNIISVVSLCLCMSIYVYYKWVIFSYLPMLLQKLIFKEFHSVKDKQASYKSFIIRNIENNPNPFPDYMI